MPKGQNAVYEQVLRIGTLRLFGPPVIRHGWNRAGLAAQADDHALRLAALMIRRCRNLGIMSSVAFTGAIVIMMNVAFAGAMVSMATTTFDGAVVSMMTAAFAGNMMRVVTAALAGTVMVMMPVPFMRAVMGMVIMAFVRAVMGMVTVMVMPLEMPAQPLEETGAMLGPAVAAAAPAPSGPFVPGFELVFPLADELAQKAVQLAQFLFI